MAVKITKTELKLEALIEKRQEIRLNFSASRVLLAGRGFGKTTTGLQFISYINEIDLQIGRLQWKVKKIQANREKRIARQAEAKVRRKLEREGQKTAVAVQEWLNGTIR